MLHLALARPTVQRLDGCRTGRQDHCRSHHLPKCRPDNYVMSENRSISLNEPSAENLKSESRDSRTITISILGQGQRTNLEQHVKATSHISRHEGPRFYGCSPYATGQSCVANGALAKKKTREKSPTTQPPAKSSQWLGCDALSFNTVPSIPMGI